MKKPKGIRQVFAGIIVVAMIIFLNGCGSKNLGVYDTTVPPEQQCTLVISKYLHVTSFNGEDVSWGGSRLTSGDPLFEHETTIAIPAGQHKLLVNYKERMGNHWRGAHDIPLTTPYLVAGKIYHLDYGFYDNRLSVSISSGDK